MLESRPRKRICPNWKPSFPPPALIIDGLFGIGLKGPLDERGQKFIGRVNQARVRVLAVDVRRF